jgi:hypothetical protein
MYNYAILPEYSKEINTFFAIQDQLNDLSEIFDIKTNLKNLNS